MKVVEIVPGNVEQFSKVINEAPSFVKFYHPNCGHCIAMADAWTQLENTSRNIPENYNIISVHADAIPKIQEKLKFKIEGYPTILTLKKGGYKHKDYKGDRSYEDLLKFLNKHLKKQNILSKRRSKRRIRKTNNINSILSGGSKKRSRRSRRSRRFRKTKRKN